jgi:hypothetical protein
MNKTDLREAPGYTPKWATSRIHDERAFQDVKLALARSFLYNNCILYPETETEDELLTKRFMRISKSLYVNMQKLTQSGCQGRLVFFDPISSNEWQIIPNTESDEFILVYREKTLCLGGSHSYIYCNPSKLLKGKFVLGAMIAIPDFSGDHVLADETSNTNFGYAKHIISFELRPDLVEFFIGDLLVLLYPDHNGTYGVGYTHSISTNKRVMFEIDGKIMHNLLDFAWSKDMPVENGIIHISEKYVFDAKKPIVFPPKLKDEDSNIKLRKVY